MILKRWSRDLITGILAALPLIITVVVITWLFEKLSSLVGGKGNAVVWFFAALLIFTAIGVLTRNWLGKKLVKIIEWYIEKIPIANKIYTTVREIRDAFIVGKEANYKRVVMVEYPQKGNWVVGFVTSAATEDMKKGSVPDSVGVFIPTAPNPTSGFLVYLSEKDIYPLDISVKDGFKMIVSAGTVKPKRGNIK